jgi:hypothetical protein
VDGALFCHLCGQPQREDLIERERAALAPPALPAIMPEVVEPHSADATGYNTQRATRAALMSAIPSFFLVPVLVMLLGGFGVFTLIPAGFFAVHLYSRGAVPGELPLTAWAGARLGWITGFFAFLLTLVPIVLASVFSETSIREMFRRQIEQQPVSGSEMQNALEVLNSPAGFAAVIGTGLVFLFVAFTVLAALGGALSAQMQVKSGAKNLT